MTRRLSAHVLLGCALALLAACTQPRPHTATAIATPSTSRSAGPTGRPLPLPTARLTPTRTPTPAVDVVRIGDRFSPEVVLRSPSGNIACYVGTWVACRALHHTWASRAPASADCASTRQVAGVALLQAGAGERSDCYDLAERSGAVLAYGRGIVLHGVRCVSEQRGITCQRRSDGAGFSISRTELSLRPWPSALLAAPAHALGTPPAALAPAGFTLSFVVPGLADCLLGEDASCLVNTQARAPRAEGTCDLDEALTAELGRRTRGRLVHVCRSDANGGQDPVRPGESVQVGDLRCDVTGRGDGQRLRCEHLSGAHHGFAVTRRAFQGY